MDDLTIYTRNRGAEGRCRACQQQRTSVLAEDDDGIAEDLPEHTCRRSPAIPRTTRDTWARAATDAHRERELRVRSERMTEINASRA